ncbi:carbohydrate ABC transporter substrate-binding protein, CUT1 family [Microbacterium hydrothermale]|uniref:extracellular solute-binding protein n=1 Tax=Microbacterium hydrothermale TaxID=857427 RepID=UPI0022272C58|nr:extracellular solute-binding protein [Microbacterium hydrothermale]MCW2162895.1 carbohydrate ABC transporter substrate-binding protein, CUT1 family [Microbacterium hydrothermale]
MNSIRGNSFTRRQALQFGGLGLGLLAAGALAGCSPSTPAAMPTLAPGADPWRRFAGTTINFLSENTAPTAAIAANLQPFYDLTGITVNVVSLELQALVQRAALDMAGGQAQYDVLYADPYQVLAPYSKGLSDLREFIDDPTYPELALGVGDFIPTQLQAAGTFGGGDEIYALPYDAPTMIWQYRADIFDKYGQRMRADLGFDPTPGLERTWEEYFQIAQWINENVSEVKYGTGQQAKQHDSLMCDFSNVLWAYGGAYFENDAAVGLVGSIDPGKSLLRSAEAIEAATFYESLVGIAHPGSRGWDWDGVGNALRAGEIAMAPNWHEYAASNEAVLPGLISYAPLPRGPKRSAHMYGGTGIAISGNSQGARRGAAWLFVNWATSPDTQLANLKSKVGGGTPTRTSVYELPEVEAATTRPSALPNMLTADAVATAWEAEYIGLRPKIPMWNECDTALFTELSRMLAGIQTPEQAMTRAADRIDQIVARGWYA